MEENKKQIAIVGIGGCFPGAVNVDEFWRVLSKGENHVDEIPPERWNLGAYYDADADAPGKMYIRKAGLIDNFDEFDNKLFGINEMEAERMDPQQRFVLECVFMALQDGGITRENIQGSNSSVYIGVMNDDYSRLTSNSDMNNYSPTGSSISIVAARVSYAFDLRGPCLAINSACSSSLLAIHLGSQALMAEDCDMAICGGVNCLLNPGTFIQLTKARMASRIGQCQAFSANADGYARGEGCGIVLLKRLSDAIKDGDKIWATVTTGTNQDGRTVTPITAPSGEQQRLLLKTVYGKASIDASEIDYIEAHGTGTIAGDPIEVQSLGKFFLDTEVQKKRYIGSVKTNIGHLESAAGIAGLIKVLLMMKNNKIVKSLLMGELNPQIDFQKFCFEVPNELKDWNSSIKHACINSFGFGGSNCHAILSSYPEKKTDIIVSKEPLLFCFSGQNMQGLTESIHTFLEFAETQNEGNLKAISYSSTVRRDHFQVRKAVIATSLKELVGKLNQGQFSETSHRHKRITFVFGGMGTAWNGMCKELMSEFKVFKEKIQEIDNSLKEYVSWSLYDRLLQDYNVDDTMFGPIAIFACQVALVTLWEHLGIKADCVLGQSIGEVAASHVAGIWSLDEAVKIIFHRTSVLAEATGGKMLMIRNSLVQQIEKVLSPYEGRANIALQYSPNSCTISGNIDALEQIEKDLLALANEQNNVTIQNLKVSNAFHSHHTEVSKCKLQRILAGMEGSNPNIEIISTVSGEKAQETDFSTPDYWGKNIRDPVLFGKAVVNAAKVDNVNVFIEIGPKPVLQAHIRDLFTDQDNVVTVPSMKQKFELNCLLETAGKMYECGINLNWDALHEEPQLNTESPKYSFCRNKFLFVSEDIRQELMGIKTKNTGHPFTKTILNNGSIYEHKVIVSPVSIATVFEHRFSGNILIPGALYAEVALALAGHYFTDDENKKSCISLKFKRPVMLQREKSEQLEIDVISTDMPESFRFMVYKKNHVYAEGKVNRELFSENVTVDIQAVKKKCLQSFPKQELYSNLQKFGMSYGEVLQIVGDSVRNETESLSEITLNSTIKQEMKGTTLHPAIVDAMLQTTAAFYHHAVDRQQALPFQVEGLRMRRPVENEMLVHTRILKQTSLIGLFHMSLLSLEGQLIVEIEKFVIKTVDYQKEEMMFETKWSSVETLLIHDYEVDPAQKLLIVADKKQNDARSSHIYLEYQDNGVTQNHLEKMLEAKGVDLKTLSAIVFLCQQTTEDSSSSETVLEIITRQSMNLRGLLLYLYTHNVSLPLFIITENAVHTGKENTPINLVAGSIWGFLRSVLREQIYSEANIVDVHTDENHLFDTMMTAAVRHLLHQDNHKGLNEFVIDKNTILCQQLCLDEDMPACRHNKLDKLCKASLFSTNEDSLWKPYFQYEKQNVKSIPPKYEEIMTTKVVIHDSCLYSQCVPVNNASKHASNVLTLEAVGSVSVDGNQKHVAVFFPCRVATFMNIPQECIIEVNNVPSYQPGLLTKLVLLWHHCVLIDQQMEIFILCSDATKPVADALTLMLETENRDTKIEIVDINSPRLIQNYSESVIVSTIQLNKPTIEAICNSWPNVKSIVCMEQILPRNAGPLLCDYNPTLKINIVKMCDILTPRSAIDNMPKLVTWIQNHKHIASKISHAFQNQTSEQMTTNAAKLMQCTTIEIFGNGGGIPIVSASEDSLLRPDGVYIVVGGLTGLGWECVRFLAARGAGAVVMMNRRKAQKDKLQEIGELEASYRCQIQTTQVDVTDMISLKLAFKTIDDKFTGKPIKGVFFGAAVLEDKTLINMSQNVFVKAAAPKIQGAWNMHLLTVNMPLDFFIMHSSVTAVFGNPGQSNYGAANAFQDSLAQKRREFGLVGQSVNWGPLKLGMLQDKPDLVKSLEEHGYIALSVDEIHKCLLSVLMLDKPTILAIQFNTINLLRSLMEEKNLALQTMLSSIFDIPSNDNSSQNIANNKQSLDVEQLKCVDTNTRIKTITEYITKFVADLLSYDPEILDLDKPVVYLGLDSMQAMTMSNKIYQTFQVRITPNALLHQNLTTNGITELLNSKLFSQMNANQPDPSNILLPIQEEELTYMEYMFYKVYCKNPVHPSLYYVNELSLPKRLAQPEILKTIADTLLSRHEVLRTTFEKVPESDHIRWNVKRKVNPVGMKPDFRIVKAEDTDDIEIHTTEVFHLEIQGPLRFIFIEGETCYLRTVCNSIGFDMQTILAIFNDIETIFIFTQQNLPLPDLQTPGGSLIVVEMEKVLQERGEELKEFWKTCLDVTIPAIRLGKPEQTSEMNPATFELKTLTLESSDYDSLLHLSQSEGLSMFKLMTSFYQLLLHLMCGETNVAISTTVDVKYYIPNASHAVGLGTNYIPLIAKFPSGDITVKEYFSMNKTALECAIDHCVYPLDLIEKLAGFEKITNITRNKIVIVEEEPVTSLLTSAKNIGYTFEVTKSDDLGTHTETQFSVWNRSKEKEMTLKLTYDLNAISNIRAENIMKTFQEIVTTTARDLSVTIASLQEMTSVKNLMLKLL